MDSLQDDEKVFDLIDMDFIRIKKYFAPKELIDTVKFLDDYGSGYFEIFSDDNFRKKVIHDFVFFGIYFGDFGDSVDE